MPDRAYWSALENLIAAIRITIDRSAGSAHALNTEIIYALDYEYLSVTRAGDGAGVDVWIGSTLPRRLVEVIMTVDLFKHDVEQKLLLGCTPEEGRRLEAFHTVGRQTGWLLWRDLD